MNKKLTSVLAVFVLLFSMTACSSPEQKKQNYYQKALAYIDHNEDKAAIIELQNAIKIDPKFADARYHLGLIYIKQRNLQGAFQELQRAASLDPANLDANTKVAEFYLLSKKKEDSRKLVETVLAKQPDYANALALLANLELMDGNFQKAGEAVDRALAKTPQADRLLNLKGKIAFDQKNFPEAEAYFQKALAAGPDNYNNYSTLVQFYFQQKRLDDGEKLLTSMTGKFPKNPQPYMMLAEFYQQKLQPDLAEKNIKKMIEIAPENVSFRILLTEFYKNLGKVDQAVATLEQGIKDLPKALDLQSALADMLFDQGKFDDAKTRMDAILKKNDKHGGANLLQAKFFIKDKKFQDSINILDSLVKNYPRWAEPSFFLAIAHLNIGEVEIAQHSVEDAVQKAPNDFRYHTLLAQINLMQRNSDSAKKESALALKLNPHDFAAAMLLSEAMLQGKEYQNAADLLEKIKLQVPDNKDMLNNLGLAYMGLKKNDKATAMFSRILELSPDNPRALAMLVSLSAGGDLPKATELVKNQIAKAPKSGGDYFLLGELLLRQQKFDDALAAFTQAKDLIPNNPEPPMRIAAILQKLGKIDQAITEYRGIIKSDPNSPSAHLGLGTLLEAQGNTQEAKKEYGEALKYKPDFAPAANNLAWLLAQDEHPDLGEALRLAMIAKQQAPDEPHIADTLGWVHYKRQSYSLAATQFQQALKVNQDDPVINYHLALALFGENEKDKAIASLKNALAFTGDFKERQAAADLLKQSEKQ